MKFYHFRPTFLPAHRYPAVLTAPAVVSVVSVIALIVMPPLRAALPLPGTWVRERT